MCPLGRGQSCQTPAKMLFGRAFSLISCVNIYFIYGHMEYPVLIPGWYQADLMGISCSENDSDVQQNNAYGFTDAGAAR
jgi:hypothetical protein